jgi:hypothetical protein
VTNSYWPIVTKWRKLAIGDAAKHGYCSALLDAGDPFDDELRGYLSVRDSHASRGT